MTTSNPKNNNQVELLNVLEGASQSPVNIIYQVVDKNVLTENGNLVIERALV